VFYFNSSFTFPFSLPAHDVAQTIHETSDRPTLIPPPTLPRFRIEIELYHLGTIAYFLKNEKRKGRETKKHIFKEGKEFF
jgi:hypothetical protein